jgi:hypothetical protein
VTSALNSEVSPEASTLTVFDPITAVAVADTVSGITSAVLALVGRLLCPLYPVLPLLASVRTADGPAGMG